MQSLLSWLARWILPRLCFLLLIPVLLLVATPFIIALAGFRSCRGQQRFGFAALDGYGAVWDSCLAALVWPFYTDLDRLERKRR